MKGLHALRSFVGAGGMHLIITSMFNRPSPDLSLILDNVCSFRVAVERHLKSRSRLPVRLFFRGDVFRFLFAGKGVSREEWPFLEKNDFNALYFPLGGGFSWPRNEDFYPVKVKTFISWSPKKYDLDRDGVSALLPRAYQENISFNFTKIALQDSE